ncbi:hypothetical protein LZ30DRAFT_743010 [Colletotrichum cereale]|nr:hypothetical protein LZ30DRAFT_743010 [Colletotrichum cereale]
MDIIVVGAVKHNGRQASISGQLTVSAPSYVTCADRLSTGAVNMYGTSFGMTAKHL